MIELTTKQKVIVVVAVVTTSFAAGRYSTPAKVVVQTKTVEIEKKVEDKKQDVAKNTRKRTKTVEDVKPSGEKVITTTVTEETNLDKKTDTSEKVSKTEDKETKKETITASDKVTISVLGGVNLFNGGSFSSSSSPLSWGLSATKPIIGPITVGLWGLNNGILGCSVGLTF